MNIDAKLLKFKSEVGEHLDKIETFKAELSNDMTKLTSINNNALGTLNSLFQSNAGKSIIAQMEYINQTVEKTNQSLESELGSTITECKNLNSGIIELESILANYNSKVSQLNNMEKDDPNRGSLQNDISRLKQNFINKNSELCNKHNSLLGKDAETNTLKDFTPSEVQIDFTSGLTNNYTGKDTTTSIFYEVDGVIYQKVLPYYLSSGGLGSSYTIAYDKNAIINAVGKDSEIGKEAISFLNSKLKGGNDSAKLWQMFNYSYTNDEYSDIAKIMDIVLEGSYKANNCKSVSDYATVAATVATNSLVHMKYDGARTSYTEGFSSVIKSGYDCIGFTTWAYYQGLCKVYNAGDNNKNVGLYGVQCNEIYYDYGTKLEKLSYEEIANIKPGAIVTRHGHIGMVIGTEKTEKGGINVVIAHSRGTAYGTVVGRWPVEKITNDWVKVMTPEDMTKRAVEGEFKS